MSTPIWTREISPEILNSFCYGDGSVPVTMMEALEMTFTEVGPDYLRATMPVDGRTHQPLGLLHGGASVALIETIASMGATWCVREDQYCVGVEINANHIRAMREGLVTGTVRPIRRGGSIHVWNGELHDESGKLVCVGRITLAVLDKRR